MRTVFADAGYFIAKLNPMDSLYARIEEVEERLEPLHIITTQMVLTEVLNHMSDRGEFSRTLASQTVARLQNSPNVEIIPQTEEQFDAAMERYGARSDQRWSLTDCASFLVMERLGITETLAYDRDFEQAGFVALLREGRAQ